MKEEGMIHLELKCLRIYKEKMVKILRIGLPSGLQSALFNLSNVTVQSSVNLFGATVVAGNSAASNIGGFIYAAMDSFSQASLTFTSQNAGAKKQERLTPVLLRALACVTVTGLTIGIGAYLAGPVLLGIYSNSAAVIEAGMVRLSIVATTYVMCGIMNVIVGGMRGLGSAFTPMIISLLGSCVFRIAWLKTVFLMPQFHHIEMVYIVYPLSWLLTISALVVAYIRLRVKVKKREPAAAGSLLL
jgi:Na+-driven multidrug efflux pump